MSTRPCLARGGRGATGAPGGGTRRRLRVRRRFRPEARPERPGWIGRGRASPSGRSDAGGAGRSESPRQWQGKALASYKGRNGPRQSQGRAGGPNRPHLPPVHSVIRMHGPSVLSDDARSEGTGSGRQNCPAASQPGGARAAGGAGSRAWFERDDDQRERAPRPSCQSAEQELWDGRRLTSAQCGPLSTRESRRR